MRTLLAVFLFALPLCAQQQARRVVVVTTGAATARPVGPTKIVRVMPAPSPSPAGAFAGSRRQPDPRGMSRGAVQQRRAQYSAWRARFRPTHPFRGVPLQFRAGWR
ncbi:MAG: hypothetical protein ACO4CZ_10005 [Planctomycetota bacterium]